MNKHVQAFSQMQMWYHKHIIHIMIFFVLTGLPIFSEQFRFLAYIFGVPANLILLPISTNSVLRPLNRPCYAIHSSPSRKS